MHYFSTSGYCIRFELYTPQQSIYWWSLGLRQSNDLIMFTIRDIIIKKRRKI